MKIKIKINTDNSSFQAEKGSFLQFDHYQLEKVLNDVKNSVNEYNLDFDYQNSIHDLNGNLIGSIEITPKNKAAFPRHKLEEKIKWKR